MEEFSLRSPPGRGRLTPGLDRSIGVPTRWRHLSSEDRLKSTNLADGEVLTMLQKRRYLPTRKRVVPPAALIRPPRLWPALSPIPRPEGRLGKGSHGRIDPLTLPEPGHRGGMGIPPAIRTHGCGHGSHHGKVVIVLPCPGGPDAEGPPRSSAGPLLLKSSPRRRSGGRGRPSTPFRLSDCL